MAVDNNFVVEYGIQVDGIGCPATTSTNTGALIVNGGAGINGNVNVSGSLNVQGSGVITTVFTSISDTTVTNTTTTTSLVGVGIGSMNVGSTVLTLGKTYRINATGVYRTGTNPGNLTFMLKVGSSVLAQATCTTISSNTSLSSWQAEARFTCRTTGTNGTVMTGGIVNFDIGSSLQGAVALNNAGTVAIVNTTITNLVDFTATWATATATNTVTCKTIVFEAMN